MCFKTLWSGLNVCMNTTLFSPFSYRLDRNGMLLKFLHILITVMYFKDRNWISKTINCISCSVVCKIVFCSEFLDIPDNAEERGGKEGEEHRQLQSVMRFTQTKKKKRKFYFQILLSANIISQDKMDKGKTISATWSLTLTNKKLRDTVEH